MAIRSLASVCLILLTSTLPAAAGTVAYWRLEEGPAGSEASTLSSEFNNSVMAGAEDGTGSNSMYFNDEVPGIGIQKGLGGGFLPNSLSLYTERIGNNRFDVDDNTNSPPLHEPTSFTYEMFVKYGEDPGDNASIYRVLARKTRSGADGSWFIMANNGRLGVRVDSNDGSTGQYNQGEWSSVANDGSLDDGLWHHVALTYDGASSTFNLYKDYSEVATLVPGNNGSIVYTGGILHVGGRNNGNGWQGWFDEVRFTDQVLSPDDFLRATNYLPEPGCWALLASGAVLLLLAGHRRRRRQLSSV